MRALCRLWFCAVMYGLLVIARPKRSRPLGCHPWSFGGVWWLLLFGLWGCQSSVIRAQSLWEVTPYRIHVWWVEAPDAQRMSSSASVRTLELQRLATSQWGAAGDVTVELAPPAWATRVLSNDLPSVREWFAEWEPARQYDRLMIVVVRSHGSATYRVATQQLDLLALADGEPVNYEAITAADLVTTALQQMTDVFTPVSRIEKIEEKQVLAVLKAGALIRPESSPRHSKRPFLAEKGDVLFPSIRRSDRYGRISAAGVQPVEWTLLTIADRQASKLQCEVESGYRQPFQKRRSSRVEQLATLVRRPYSETTLKLVDRTHAEQGLAGYEIYLRGDDEGESRRLGQTNWRGEFTLPVDPEAKSLTLFVKSGQQLLAKLPIVPGASRMAQAAVRNDERRLEAEGFLLGVQDSLLDLVARREVMAARIRDRIENRDFEEAQDLLAQLQRLETEDEFVRRIQQRKQSLSAVDAQVQRKIDQLFADTGSLLNRFLDPSQVQQLSQTLQEAKRSGDKGKKSGPADSEISEGQSLENDVTSQETAEETP